MTITFINPLSNAWNRMISSLFKPFDIVKWFVVGFTAFLAGLTDGPFGGGGGGGSSNIGGDHFNLDGIMDAPFYVWEWLMNNIGWFILIAFGICFITVLIVVLTWLSSRGKFMFLDNVVHNRAQVAKPWTEFSKLGNSLFLWRLIFGLICFGLILAFIISIFFTINYYHNSYQPVLPILLMVGIGLTALFSFITIAFIASFLNNFVVPLMYKNQVKIIEGWRQFLQLFRKQPVHFILFCIFLFILHILVFFVIIIAGLFTCCIGFILFIIPYISSVVLLPFGYTFRAYGVEFLEQFGSEYKIFPENS
jgi:hypothetical protein